MDKSTQIKVIKAKIALLDAEKEQLLKKLGNIEKETAPSIDSLPAALENSSNQPISLDKKLESTQEQQIKLFRTLFRGRDDVYARLWISRKAGRSGYSPVCKNEWAPKICQKPIMKCSHCPNRELMLLDDEVIRRHLSGAYVVGIYPMLQDETCYFLAVDFDGEHWVDNIFAFRKTCEQEGVPVAVERSRSGNGAHVWMFFEKNIPASLARKMGSFLITKTMSDRYQLDMKSYDRLFPNQDTLPKGGFGNLIALPFQKEAVKKGNSIFIDEKCNPYHDQWEFLSVVKHLSISDVERFSKERSKDKQAFGVRMSPVDENDPPWMRLPSGKRKYKPTIKDLPQMIELVVANRVYIKTDGVPSVLLNQIKQLGAFQNPEFYRRQNMRLSTFLTPRIICCSEILDGYLSIPRGCLEDATCLIEGYGIKVDIRDERIEGQKVKFKFYGTLTKEQRSMARSILKNDIGVAVALPGTGKTVVAIHAITKRKTNTLILVHRRPLLEQWRLQLASFLGLELKDIGQIGAGKDKANGNLDVAMIQSMERKGTVDDRIIDYGFIIADECHHISAVTFERVLMQAKAKYILGLTSTPYRKDGHQPIIHMQCGPIYYQKKQTEIAQQVSKYLIIPRMTKFKTEWKEDSNIYDLWPKLIGDEERNRLIINDVLRVIEEGRFPIIITERREHLRILSHMLEGKIQNLVVLYGGLNMRGRREMLEKLTQLPFDKTRAILATGTYIGEGFDKPQLDTLFITMPISFKGRVVQYAGRLHRKYNGKMDIKIYDYVDADIPVLWRMYERRLTTYKSMGYINLDEDV